MKIFKYPLQLIDAQTIEMPSHAVPLSIQLQYDQPMLWAAVEPLNAAVQLQVVMVGPGHEAPDLTGYRYMGTIQLGEGRLILHCFIQVDMLRRCRGPAIAELPR